MGKTLRPPFPWFGGKSSQFKQLYSIYQTLPAHQTYVEVFGGSAGFLFGKPPSPVEVYNDIDSGLVNFFRVLRDKDQFQELHRLCSLTPYSREEYYHCLHTYDDEDNTVMRAYKWYVVARFSFSGLWGHSFKYGVASSSRNMSRAVSMWLSIIDLLPELHDRIMRVQIEHRDFRDLIKTYDRPETLFYLDPPYIPETRRSGQYKHEMDEQDHKDLVDILLGIEGNAMLSGYEHPLYHRLEVAGWNVQKYDVPCSAAGNTIGTGIIGKGAMPESQYRTECVWYKHAGQKQMTLF